LSDGIKTWFLLNQTMREFKNINEGEGLTDADKKQLKEFYLQNFIAPEARKLLEKQLAAEEARGQRIQNRQRFRPRQNDRQ
jgi:hypothetical protein